MMPSCYNTSGNYTREESSLTIVRSILELYVGPGICVFGLMGNLAAIIVLRRLPAKATVYLLTALAAVDWVFLLLELVSFHVHEALCVKLTLIWSALLHTRIASVYLVVSVSLERYIVVCHPLRVHSYCTVGNAKRIVTVILIFCIFYCTFDYAFCFIRATSESLDDVNHTYRTIYFVVYRTALDPFIHFLIPFNVLFILNIKLIRSISSAHKEHCLLSHKSSDPGGEESHSPAKISPKPSTTVNIIAVVSVFLLTQPAVLVNNMWELDHHYWGYLLYQKDSKEVFDNVIRPVAMCLLAVPSAVNFIIYALFYKRFRNTFKLGVCCSGRRCYKCSRGMETNEMAELNFEKHASF